MYDLTVEEALSHADDHCRARLIAADDQSAPANKGAGEKPARDSTSQDREKVVIDPSKGGAVSPKAQKQSKALEVPQGRWVWDGLAKILEVDLFSPAWEVRHGAAMALRELLKLQGKYGGMQGRAIDPFACAG